MTFKYLELNDYKNDLCLDHVTMTVKGVNSRQKHDYFIGTFQLLDFFSIFNKHGSIALIYTFMTYVESEYKYTPLLKAKRFCV